MRSVRALRTEARTASSVVEAVQRELVLLALLRISPVESWQASTPELRRLLVRARVATARSVLASAAEESPSPSPSPPRPVWPAAVASMASGARDALLEATLAPLACASPGLRPDARRRLRLAVALMRLPIEARAAWRDVERLGRRAPRDLRHAWDSAVCALLRVDAEGWRATAAAHLHLPLQPLALAEVDPEVPCDWRRLQALHGAARHAQPQAALRIACLLACCEALRLRRLRLRTRASPPLPLPVSPRE